MGNTCTSAKTDTTIRHVAEPTILPTESKILPEEPPVVTTTELTTTTVFETPDGLTVREEDEEEITRFEHQ